MITLMSIPAPREVGRERRSSDVSKLNQLGIAISSTPIAVDDATADVAIFLMLGALRQVTIPMTAIREGKFRGDTPIGHDPRGKLLGILGMGGIGRVGFNAASALSFLTNDRQWQNELEPLA
jgi:lactate dehydrogenase-like 2-hydroxyacid dehydrogenase